MTLATSEPATSAGANHNAQGAGSSTIGRIDYEVLILGCGRAREQFLEAPDCGVPVEGSHRAISRANAQRRLHARRPCRIELGRDIRNEQQILRLKSHDLRNLPVARGISLGARRRIEVMLDEGCQVARLRVREEQLLREHAPGRKNSDLYFPALPARERRWDVRKHLPS